MLAHVLPVWLWHPLGQCAGTHAEMIRCKSYNFWSGTASDAGEITLVTGLLAAAIGWYVRRECHVESPKNCRRIGHHVPGTAHFACREHHPHAEVKGSVTAADILRHHEDSEA
jgi:hypothetical protein